MPLVIMTAKKLKDVNFVDLYITGNSFEISIGSNRSTVDNELKGDAVVLREACKQKLSKTQIPEFSIKHDDVLYRVTVLNDPAYQPIFFIRKSTAQILPLDALNIREDVEELISKPVLDGLILIAGKMANGKTTTASSIVSHRLNLFGRVAVAIEDPIETNLGGQHGSGICYQSEASRFDGGYKESLIRTLRTGTDIIFIGEIRDSDTASEVVKASINGHLIISTIHAGSIKEAIEKLYRLCDVSTRQSLGEGLQAVVHQTLENIGKGTTRRRLVSNSFIMNDAARSMILSEDFPKISQIVTEQLDAQIWKSN